MSSQNRKVRPNSSRTSEPVSKLQSGVKSAGNSPASSPVLSRRVLSQTLPGLPNISIISDGEKTGDTTLIDVVSISDPETPPKTQIKAQADCAVTNKCPCMLPSLKSSIFIKCMNCSLEWHSTCVNLTGITAAAVKKMAGWKCPQCYISPFSEKLCGDADAFAQFKNAMKNIKEVNGNLAENSNAIEFFNSHLKHLLLEPAEFLKHSERIGAVEKGVSEIKDILCKLPNSLLTTSEDELAEMKEIRNELTAVQEKVEHIKSLGGIIDQTNKRTEQNLTELQLLISERVSQSPVTDSSAVRQIENKIIEINEQHVILNQHVGPMSAAIGSNSSTSPEADDTLPMTPNTVSPHMSPEQNANSEQIVNPYEPYVCYKENAIEAELKDRLLEFVESTNAVFKPVGDSRDVIYLGEYGYWYTGAYHEAARTPEVVQDLLEAVRPCLTNSKAWMNSCLITRYKSGADNIPLHRDDEAFIDPTSEILSVSIGAERSIQFVDNTESREESIMLADCSAYVMSRKSQAFWRHGIPTQESESESQSSDSQVRYSFTFRHLAPYFKNSTVIIGDSNTKNFEFGVKRGQFGRWLPGKRIKASKVQDIPEPVEIGPYRNIIIHTGINNITDRESMKSILCCLKRKCDRIQLTYPHAKLHLSLLLPTKSTYANARVSELNSRILELSYTRKNTFIIDNSNLGNDRGCLPPEMGRYIGERVKSSDIVHLGRRGISKFCANIKHCIVGKSSGNVSQSTERFRGGRGDYRAAAYRGILTDSQPV